MCRWGSAVPIYILFLLACYSGVCLAPECRGWQLTWVELLLLCLFCFNNCGYFSRGNWPRCSSIKQVHGSWHGIRSWGVFPVLWGCGSDCSSRLLSFLGIATAGGRNTFFLLELSCGIGDSLKCALH